MERDTQEPALAPETEMTDEVIESVAAQDGSTEALTAPQMSDGTARKPAGISLPLIIAAVTVLGAVLRLRFAGVRQFWGDEVHTFQVANEPSTLVELWHKAWNAKLMADPPFYYILSFFTAHGAVSYSELRLRSLSLLFGIAAIPMMYLLVKRVASSSTAVVAALLLSLSTFAIQYAQEHRPYSMLLFLSILFMYCLTRLVSEFSWSRWAAVFAASLLLIYTHYFGGFLLVAGYLVWILSLLFQRSREPVRAAWTGVALLPVALAVAYIPVLVHMPEMAASHTTVLGEGVGPSKGALQEYLDQKKPLPQYFPDLMVPFSSWRLGIPDPWILRISAILAGVGCLFTLIRKPRLFAGAATLFAIGFVLSVAFYELLKFPFDPRRSIFLLPLFIWFIAEGATAPWRPAADSASAGKAMKLVSISITVTIVSVLATASLRQYGRYTAGGWRNEKNQADWRGMARFLSQMSDKDDVINVPTPGDTWLRLHYHFYHEQYLPGRPFVSAHAVPEIQEFRQKGKPMWFLLNQPWELPPKTFEFLVAEGDWTAFFGAWVVFLPPSNADPGEQYLICATQQRAALFPKRGGIDGDVLLSGSITANLKYDQALQSTPPILQFPAGVYHARIKPSTPTADLNTTLTLFPIIKPGEWQNALVFDEILPGSMMIDPKLQDGEPHLFMQHNGSVRYRFYLTEGGDFTLSLRAKHDRPGPISLRVFATGTGETERFVFDEATNSFGTVSKPVRLLTGINEITVYYNSFKRLNEEFPNAEDGYNSFHFAGWKLESSSGTTNMNDGGKQQL